MTKVSLLTFYISEQIYAIPIAEVVEIRGEEQIVKVPNAPVFIEGIITLREKVIPIVYLRKRLNLEEIDLKNTPYNILIVKIDNRIIGLIVDRVSGVLKVEEERLTKSPAELKGDIERELIRSIFNLNNKIIFVLELKNILKVEEIEEIKELKEEKKITLLPQQQLIYFLLGKDWYALNVEEVKEIIKVKKFTPIPYVPHFVLGMINLRSNVLCCIDIRHFLGVEEVNQQEIKNIIVIQKEDVVCGLLVDNTPQIIKVYEDKIQLTLSTKNTTRVEFIKGEVDIDGKILSLLNIDKIIELQTQI